MQKVIKFVCQACRFKKSKNSKWQVGIAFQDYLNSNDVKFIIDELGVKAKSVYDYDLENISFNNIHVAIDLNKI